jgi:hypothetical protein
MAWRLRVRYGPRGVNSEETPSIRIDPSHSPTGGLEMSGNGIERVALSIAAAATMVAISETSFAAEGTLK